MKLLHLALNERVKKSLIAEIILKNVWKWKKNAYQNTTKLEMILIEINWNLNKAEIQINAWIVFFIYV